MRLAIVLDPADLRQWHFRLVEALRADGHAVAVLERARHPVEAAQARKVAKVCAFERKTGLMPVDHPTAPATAAQIAALHGGAAPGTVDCTIDLVAAGNSGPVLAPTYDGSPSEAAGSARVRAGDSPSVGIALRMAGGGERTCVALARPAFKDRTTLARNLDHVALAVQQLLLQTVRRLARGDEFEALSEEPRAAAKPASAVGFALGAFAGRALRRSKRFFGRVDHWRIGWRWCGNEAVRERLDWPAGPYDFIADDGKRYFADPFVFWHEGKAHVFCEELPFGTGKGVISLFTLSADGVMSAPRVVLERPYHLSYPFVFAEDGEIWMIPETSANRTIELYRATRFPDEWVREAVLVEDVVAADATLLTHGGRRWLFASLAAEGGSSWDNLGLFHAPRLAGPWTAHPLNPVVIDVRAARPAGMMFQHGGRLLRPAQDCSDDYGAALTLYEVTRLDPEGYGQRLVRRLTPPSAWRGDGVHTLNEAGGLEVVDCVGWRSRWYAALGRRRIRPAAGSLPSEIGDRIEPDCPTGRAARHP
jgi:hypothetical protein